MVRTRLRVASNAIGPRALQGTITRDRARRGGAVSVLACAWVLAFAGPATAPAGADPIGQVTTYPTTILRPQSITTGPDGNVWFTNGSGGPYAGTEGGSSIGRITPSGTITAFTSASLGNPDGIVSGADGNLWFLNRSRPSIGRITPSGAISAFADASMTWVGGIAAGPDGNIWFTNRQSGTIFGTIGANAIERITPSGTVTEFALGSVEPSGPITTGPDGNLWFAMPRGVARLATDGTLATFVDPAISNIASITTGPDGNLWLTNKGNNTIGRVTTGGVITFFGDPTISGPTGVTSGADGALWFTNESNSSLGRITTSGTISNVTGTNINAPRGITSGPDGRLWFANDGDSTIGRSTTGGSGDHLTGNGIDIAQFVAAGPDGNIWFGNGGGSPSIGRITASGMVSSFVDPLIVRDPQHLVFGPDGSLWFTGGSDLSIRRRTPDGTVSVMAPPGTPASSLLIGPDGNAWYAAPNTIGRITLAGVRTVFTTAGLNHVNGMIVGPDGTLWFLYGLSPSTRPTGIGKITPSGAITLIGGLNDPSSLVAGPDGNVWFASPDGNAIGRVTPAGAVTLFTAGASALDLIAGADGNLWFHDYVGDVHRITTSGVATTFHPPVGVQDPGFTLGPDGNLWFAAADQLVRVNTDGTFATVPVPGVGLDAHTALLSGPDGNIWFAAGMGMSLEKVGIGLPAIRGTVRELGTGTPLGGIVVTVMNQWPAWTIAATSTTGPDGTYAVAVPAGSYAVRFLDPTGAHQRSWFTSSPTYKTATTLTVTSGVLTADRSMAPSPGSLRGRTTHGPAGDAAQPVAGISVRVFDVTSHSLVASSVTGSDGYYVLGGLAPGGYVVQFVDPTRAYRATWFAGVLLPGNASTVRVGAGATAWASVWVGI
jgi:streptogramin lyase